MLFVHQIVYFIQDKNMYVICPSIQNIYKIKTFVKKKSGRAKQMLYEKTSIILSMIFSGWCI